METWTGIHWYKVPPGTPFLPVPSFIANESWYNDNGMRSPMYHGNSPGVQGCQWVDRPFRKQPGQYPWEQFTGHYCGTADQWAGSLRTDRAADVRPVPCCGIDCTAPYLTLRFPRGCAHCLTWQFPAPFDFHGPTWWAVARVAVPPPSMQTTWTGPPAIANTSHSWIVVGTSPASRITLEVNLGGIQVYQWDDHTNPVPWDGLSPRLLRLVTAPAGKHPAPTVTLYPYTGV